MADPSAVMGHDLDGWIPCRIHWQPQGPVVEWCYLGAERLTDPFFDMTVARMMRRPFRALFRRQTPISVLEERARSHPGIPPTGLIFHQGRCGSTLVAQMLAAAGSNVVVSEAGCIEDLVWASAWNPSLPADVLAGWLGALIAALGQPRGGRESHYFLKLQPLETLALPLFRRALPTTPWNFLYRDPVEILVSLARRRPAFATPGAAPGGFFPIHPAQAMSMTPDEYGARLLERVSATAAAHIEKGDGLVVNYEELPGAFWSRIAPHFGCSWDADERAAMEKASERDAKGTGNAFTPDAESKRREATAEIRRWAALLDPVYRRLEATRQG